MKVRREPCTRREEVETAEAAESPAAEEDNNNDEGDEDDNEEEEDNDDDEEEKEEEEDLGEEEVTRRRGRRVYTADTEVLDEETNEVLLADGLGATFSPAGVGRSRFLRRARSCFAAALDASPLPARRGWKRL